MTAAVEVWSLDLAAGSAGLFAIEAEAGLLSDEDRTRVAAMADRAQANDRLAVVIALRILLAGLIGKDAASAAFEIGHRGKPSLPGSRLGFSFSHSDRLALIAVATSAVGIDVERPRAVRLDEARRLRIERAAETMAPGRPLPRDSGQRRFLQAWTRLEALSKADGRGIGWMLAEIGAVGPDRPQHGMVSAGLRAVMSRFETVDLAAPGDALAAVAVEGGARSRVVQQLPNDASGLRELLRRTPDADFTLVVSR